MPELCLLSNVFKLQAPQVILPSIVTIYSNITATSVLIIMLEHVGTCHQTVSGI